MRSTALGRLRGEYEQNNPECLENPHGFVWNHLLALQFHLEVCPGWVHMLAKRDARELVPARFVQSAEEILSKPDGLYGENNALMNRLLRRSLEHVHGSD